MLFKEVIGQKEVKQRLLQLAKDQRVGHAILFTGNEGSGKLGLAIAFARYLNCKKPGEYDSCNECSSCRKYSKLVHPDLHLVFPVAETRTSGKNPVSDDFLPLWREFMLSNPYMRPFQWYEYAGIDKKQGSISKNESLQIIKKLSFKNYEALYKVVIIWMAEKMNLSAANKLLKILEEPPPGTVFLLVAEDAGQMIPTILSRTQLIRVPAIEPDCMAAALGEVHGINGQDRIASLVSTAGGNYLKLLEALGDSEENSFHFERFTTFMRLCFSIDLPGISGWIDDMADRGREKHKQFLQYALHMIRGNFMMNIGAVDLDRLSEEERSFSTRFSAFIHSGNVFAIYDELNRAFTHVEYNGNGRLIFFDLAIKVARLLKTR
jgi:DNA polymerase III subunit delta'